MKLTETFVKRLKDVRGRAVGFRVDQVKLPNGNLATRDYLDHPGAVAVIALASADKVLMVRQFRFPVNQVTLEIPAGKLDKGDHETPLSCAKRELEEETGYKAGRIRKLMSFWPTAAFANEIIHIYIADKLKRGTRNLDEDEFLNCEAISLKTLYRKVDRGEIKDAKTLIALLAYRCRSRT